MTRFSGRQSQEGARLYRIGDLASIAPDEMLHGLGRYDLQTKLRGQRIDLLAIQHHVFHSFPGARDVMAEVISCSGQPEALMAFVVSSDESTANEQSKEVSFLSPSTKFSSAVRATQTQPQLELPPYAVPSIFIPIAHMPLNENGKANRHHIVGAAACLTLERYEEAWDSGKVYDHSERYHYSSIDSSFLKIYQLASISTSPTLERIFRRYSY